MNMEKQKYIKLNIKDEKLYEELKKASKILEINLIQLVEMFCREGLYNQQSLEGSRLFLKKGGQM